MSRVLYETWPKMLIRIEKQIIPGTYDYLCWGITCFGSYNAGDTTDWYVDDQAVVNAQDTAGGTGLVVYFQPNDLTGNAKYEYRQSHLDSITKRIQMTLPLFSLSGPLAYLRM